MTVIDNSTASQALFSDVSVSDSFKDTEGAPYIKMTEVTDGENAVNLTTGEPATFLDTDTVQIVVSQITLTN